MDRSVIRTYSFLRSFSVLLLLPVIFAGKCSREPELTLGPVPFPEDNPMTKEKIALGRKLFFDKRLSDDNTLACVDCHLPERAFTDGKARSNGIRGGMTERNSPSLLNSAYLPRIMFDGELKTLEMQAIVPIQEHVEMGSNMLQLIKELRAIPEYEEAAQRIFNRSFDPWVLTRALAAFERSLLSQNSPFDRFLAGDTTALTVDQRRGWKLFSQELYCTKCHPAPHFTTYANVSNGLYEDYGKDQGRYRIDNKESDKGVFKIPSLRNIGLTAPYMHDGSFPTLDAVIDHYSTGGKNHPNKSPLIKDFVLTDRQRNDLKLFFQSLTDTTYLKGFQ